ncbi:MAG: conjugal transfer protein MobC [Flavisolibacter sp.]
MPGTGENEQALRKIMDLTRFAGIAVLLLHFYHVCYRTFVYWGWRAGLTDRLMQNLARTGLFRLPVTAKCLALCLLMIAVWGHQGRRDKKPEWSGIAALLVCGALLYFGSSLLLALPYPFTVLTILYMATTLAGSLFLLSAAGRVGRMFPYPFPEDVFNTFNESFPQEERWLSNAHSINLPARYLLRGKTRKSWINIINPFRGLLVVGSPGAGKTWFVIQHVIKQHMEKGFALFVYDFKYDDLSRITYNWWLRNGKCYRVKPSFYLINFDDLSRSHRCNPLDPASMQDLTDATESARTILLGLNREWIRKQGDFFVESPINILTAVIWFLRRYQEGKYCTLPHVIELLQTEYEQLFALLNTEPEIEVLVNPFITAYQHDAMEQLEGQVASAKIGMARLASPPLYWVLTGKDFTLDINNPKAPKILCMGNNPEKHQTYGAVLSLFVSRMIRQVNKKGMMPCSLVFDEFPTIYVNHIDSLIATARSNKVATTLAMQDFSQLKKDYGRDQAEVIVNITGNIICGQVMGETSRILSERFGKILQDRQSYSVNRVDTSVSHSRQLESAIPPATIASLSSGTFVGMVADQPEEPIRLKMFHAQIENDTRKLEGEARSFTDIPRLAAVSQQEVMEHFYQVKLDIKKMVMEEVASLKKHKGREG